MITYSTLLNVGADKLQYFGKVFVFFGSKTGLSTTPNITLHYHNESQYTNFGFTVNKCDGNLLVSSPFDGTQKGLVQYINTSRSDMEEQHGGSSQILNSENAQNFSWYGYSTACGKFEGADVSFVGSPTYR